MEEQSPVIVCIICPKCREIHGCLRDGKRLVCQWDVVEDGELHSEFCTHYGKPQCSANLWLLQEEKQEANELCGDHQASKAFDIDQAYRDRLHRLANAGWKNPKEQEPTSS